MLILFCFFFEQYKKKKVFMFISLLVQPFDRLSAIMFQLVIANFKKQTAQSVLPH